MKFLHHIHECTLYLEKSQCGGRSLRTILIGLLKRRWKRMIAFISDTGRESHIFTLESGPLFNGNLTAGLWCQRGTESCGCCLEMEDDCLGVLISRTSRIGRTDLTGQRCSSLQRPLIKVASNLASSSEAMASSRFDKVCESIQTSLAILEACV